MSISSRRLVPAVLVPVIAVFGAAVGVSPAGASTASVNALLTSALKLTNAVTSVAVDGHGTSSGKAVKIVVSAGQDQAFGVLSFGGQSTTVRRVGTDIYQKSSKGFLRQQGESASQAAVTANKWFKIPASTSNNYTGLHQYLSVTGLLTGLVPTSATGPIKTKASTLNGQPVEVISGTFQGTKETLYVATHGKPYVLRVSFASSRAGSGITVDLSQFNKPVHTTVPKGAVSQ